MGLSGWSNNSGLLLSAKLAPNGLLEGLFVDHLLEVRRRGLLLILLLLLLHLHLLHLGVALNHMLDLVDEVLEDGLEAQDLAGFSRLHHLEQTLNVNKAL